MKKNSNSKWLITVTLLAFGISMIMSLFSTLALKNVPLIIAIIITLAFVAIGIIFDIIGVAVTSGDITVFNSMSARKVRGGKVGVKMLKNTSKVSSVCCDVVGDVCGIVSGASGAVIVTLIINLIECNELIVTLLVSALISSMTIGGKAMGKSYAIKESSKIITIVSKTLSVFTKN